MRCKLQVDTPSGHTYSLFWAELSRLLGEKNPCCYSGAGTYSVAHPDWSQLERIFNNQDSKLKAMALSKCDTKTTRHLAMALSCSLTQQTLLPS